VIETLVSIIFTIEYVLRIISCRNIFKFFITPLNIVDLLAFLPFYMNLAFNSANVTETRTLRVLRIARLARVFRLLKMGRYSTYLQIMGRSLDRSADAFGLLLFLMSITIVIFSSLMYYIERGEYDLDQDAYLRSDGNPSPFTSIPASFWWCLVTMSTVGYGEVFPIEPLGKIIGGITMISGILVLALPITILGSNFQDVFNLHKNVEAAIKEKKRQKTVSQMKLGDHIQRLKTLREDLDHTLKDVRAILERDVPDYDHFHMWTSVDSLVITTLSRVENFLEKVQLPVRIQDIKDDDNENSDGQEFTEIEEEVEVEVEEEVEVDDDSNDHPSQL